MRSWHAFFNQARAKFTAASFLGSCVQLVQRAAVELQLLTEQSLTSGTTLQSAAAGARKPKSPADGRLRANESKTRQTTAGARKDRADMDAWAAGRAAKAVVTIDAYMKRLAKAAQRAVAATAQLAAQVAAQESGSPRHCMPGPGGGGGACTSSARDGGSGRGRTLVGGWRSST